LYICNGNTAYSQISPGLIEIYEYVNLPPGMTSYCEYMLNRSLVKWQIPLEIADETKYRVETHEVSYNGKNAFKTVVTVLMSEEEKQKQLAIGKIPREKVVTYWFAADTLAILKEETLGFSTIGEASQVIGGPTTIKNEREIETRTERVYEGFYFDIDIADAEFEMDPANYPGVEFRKVTVDAQDKFK
jgi:hypothetical protein